MTTMTDQEVRKLQEEWNPAQYDDEPNDFTRDMLQRVANSFYTMSTDEYRQVLREQSETNAATRE